MSLALDILSWALVWWAVSVVLGVAVGRWLYWGSGRWLLDEWAESDQEEFDRAV